MESKKRSDAELIEEAEKLEAFLVEYSAAMRSSSDMLAIELASRLKAANGRLGAANDVKDAQKIVLEYLEKELKSANELLDERLEQFAVMHGELRVANEKLAKVESYLEAVSEAAESMDNDRRCAEYNTAETALMVLHGVEVTKR